MQTHTVAGSQRGGRARAESEQLARGSSSVPARGGMTPESISPLLLRSLAQPSAYPNDASAASGVEQVQTHISHLFLTPDRVYKLRKAVNLGFVDFTTRSERNADCVREVQLNRRLAPDVYLGVAPLEKDPGGFIVGELADTPPAALTDASEHCVVMRRLPTGRDALSLLSAGRLTRRHIDAVAERIASFHQENRLPPQSLASDRSNPAIGHATVPGLYPGARSRSAQPGNRRDSPRDRPTGARVPRGARRAGLRVRARWIPGRRPW